MLETNIKLAQRQAEKAMRSPTTMKILTNPRVQRTMMQAINLRADLHQRVTSQVQGFAKSHNLVTREDVAKLRRTLREMEGTISVLRTELATETARGEAAREQAQEATSKAAKASATPRKSASPKTSKKSSATSATKRKPRSSKAK